MWYKIDLYKLMVHLLPPILRSKFLVSFLGVLTCPLRRLYNDFVSLRNDVENRMDTTCNVVSLDNALNSAFFLTDSQIYIDTPEETYSSAFYYYAEMQRANILYRLHEGSGFVLMGNGIKNGIVNFTVHVPSFLCTSLESKEQDKYRWKYLAIIKKILKSYKPAGRTFSIDLYDYE